MNLINGVRLEFLTICTISGFVYCTNSLSQKDGEILNGMFDLRVV